jgi:hypothetical protein
MKVTMRKAKTMKQDFLDQHLGPKNAIIKTGTTVSWVTGDVGHKRTINVLNIHETSLFNTGENTR